LFFELCILEQTRLLTSFHSTIILLENDAEMIHLVKEEALPTDMLLGLFHLRDNDPTSNGILSLELQTYVRCATEGFHPGRIREFDRTIFELILLVCGL
jgi:hypothetical protein